MSYFRDPDEEIVIDVWLHYYRTPDFVDPVKKLAERFQRNHPGYRINIESHHFLTMPETVSGAAEQGRAPTIAEYFCMAIQEAFDVRNPDGTPLFTSVEQAIGGRTEILGEPVTFDDIVPAARDSFSYGGELVSMPWMVSTPLLYANRTLLERAGIAALPRTWADLERAGRAVMALPDGPPYGFTWANFGWFFLLAVAQQGGLLTDHDNGRTDRAETFDLASAEMMAFVRWWRRLHADGCYYYSGTPAALGSADSIKAFGETMKAFQEQRVAFTFSSSVDAASLKQIADASGFELAVGPVPHRGDVPYVGNLIGGDSLWLAGGLDRKKQDGALAFLQYLNNPRNAADRHKDTFFSPATSAAVDLLADEGWFTANPHLRAACDIIAESTDSAAVRGAVVVGLNGVQDVLSDAMHDVLASAADPDQRFTAATDQAQKLLDDYRRRYPGGIT